MPYSRPLRPNDDLRGLPEALIPNNYVFQMLVNCYQLCRVNLNALSDARRTNTALAHRYRKLSRQFFDVLKTNRAGHSPLEQADIAVLRGRLESVNVDDALIRAAALLSGLSLYLAGRERRQRSFMPADFETSSQLGSERILVAPRWPGVIAELLDRLPRSEEQVSEMMPYYHPGLHLTPAEVGPHTLAPRLLPRNTAELFQRRLDARVVKVAVTPLTRDAVLHGHSLPAFPPGEPARFLLDSTGDEQPQIAFLQAVLERCRDEGVSILVLPELRMPPGLFSHVTNFLRRQTWPDLESGRGLLLVAAGSWHLRVESEWVNRCRVLDHGGDEIWFHDKLAEYNITPENVTANPELKRLLGIGDAGGTECIHRGVRLDYCDSPWGRLAVAICAGFFYEGARNALRASQAELFLVPAMTPDVQPIRETARNLVRSHWASTFVANCGTVGRDRDKGLSFYQIPAAGAAPTVAGPNEAVLVFDLAMT